MDSTPYATIPATKRPGVPAISIDSTVLRGLYGFHISSKIQKDGIRKHGHLCHTRGLKALTILRRAVMALWKAIYMSVCHPSAPKLFKTIPH